MNWPSVPDGFLFIDLGAGATSEREHLQQTISDRMAAMPRKWYTGLHQFFDEGSGNVGGDAYLLMNERPGLQDRFGLVRCGYIGALEEEADGNLIAPEQRFFHRCLKVRGIVCRIVFELFDPRPEPLEGIVVVIGHAWAE